jgi:hypothetical protein
VKHVNSYDPNARVPKLGSRWVWEIDKPHACALLEVIEVIWNGEEWWVRTQALWEPVPAALLRPSAGPIALNDVGRFWEAVTPVGGTGMSTRHSEHRSVREGTEARWGDPEPVRA